MTPAKSRAPVWGALLGSGAAGALVAVQSRLNGGLSNEIGDGYLTATISFSLGLLVVVGIAVCSRRARSGFSLVGRELRTGRLPVWALTGGIFGACFVLGQGLIATSIGLALFAVGIVAGQVVGGLIIDRLGVGPGGKMALSVQRIVGTMLAIIAVAFSVFATRSDEATGNLPIWMFVVPVLIGVGLAMQAAVNGLVRAAAHSAITATVVSFSIGTVVLVIASIVSVAANGWPSSWPTEPWLYFGGPLGVLFIALAALLVRTAGVLLLSMSNVAGQLVASVAIEAGLPLASGVTPMLLAGAALALLAVVAAAVPARRS